VLIAIHAVLALDCAAALNFYSITGFDKFLHTFFGFLGAAVLFVIMLYCNADKMNKFGFYILLLFAVLGIGALWEIWEYTSDALLGTRCQGWQLGKGLHLMTVDEYFKTYNPMTDTMWDLIVTIFGTLIFYLFLFVDKLLGSKIYNSIIRQVKSSAKEKSQSENNSPAAKNSLEVKGGEKNKKDK
jgi:hypothetical protein